MKIPSIDQIREVDKYTIENEPISSVDLMERAGKCCFEWIIKKIRKKQKVNIFAGLGNNGGDGLVIARLLAQNDFEVQVFMVDYSGICSEDCRINLNRLSGLEKVKVRDIKNHEDIPQIGNDEVIIDAIFGSGLSKPITGIAAEVINTINSQQAVVVSIDMPSGLFPDCPSDEKKGPIIHADYTITLQFPKLAFLFAENDIFTGQWEVIPIGLNKDFIDGLEVKNFLVLKNDILPHLKPRRKFSHKGNYGHALLISGSYGKLGAAILASRACLRSGVGLITTHIPGNGYRIIQTASPETMVSIDGNKDYFSEVPELSPYNAISVGPGIGTEKQTANALKLLIQNASVPIVFDADAINILGENKTWISFIPKNSIFTPHLKEFERMVGKFSDSFECHQIQREFSIKHGVFVVLKGAHTAISCPDGEIWFNTTGNPGMATAGSGDVLTGIVTSLMAQGYHPKYACLIGVYLHGLAGDIASKKLGFEALIAGDIIDNLGKAFKKLWKI